MIEEMFIFKFLILTCYKGLQSGQIAPVAGLLFSRGSGAIWSVCYFKVGNLCYGRLSFRVSNDNFFAFLLLTPFRRLVLSFKRLDCGLV